MVYSQNSVPPNISAGSVKSHFIKFLPTIPHHSYDRLKFRIFARLGLNPDYTPELCSVLQL